MLFSGLAGDDDISLLEATVCLTPIVALVGVGSTAWTMVTTGL
jgi:hypothetical protein